MARILVVDDSEVNRDLIHAFLEGEAYVLFDASSGEEALEVAARAPPDLVLLDVMMPGIDGFETARRLKKAAGEDFLPVILLTSLSDQESRVRGLETGADEFLTKPVNAQELHARIRSLLRLRAKERALAEQNLRLLELDRFKNDMSSLVVHDLRGLVAVILANLDLLARQLDPKDELCAEALADSRAATRRLLNLLANLLDTARIENDRMELDRGAVELRTLLGDVVRQHRPTMQERGLQVTIDALPEILVDADADVLGRVVENIIANAMRYTPKGGRIVLDVERGERTLRIRIGNNGAPIPEAARATIFDKFAQVSPDRGRMNIGLGLYFCRLALEAHGGRIWVEETPALPTVFVLELPAEP